jgi:outer membrane protein TolC
MFRYPWAWLVTWLFIATPVQAQRTELLPPDIAKATLAPPSPSTALPQGPWRESAGDPSFPLSDVTPANEKIYPINLATALQLADVRSLDIALATERIKAAAAQLERSKVLWLPTVLVGTDYFRHDGQLQDVAGNVFGTSKSAFMVGAGPLAIFAVSDAIFQPLAERQTVRARQADFQTAKNDTMLAVAEVFLAVQQARGELAGAEDAAKKAEELVRRAGKLAKGLVAPVEEIRARTELSRRRQAVQSARERWRIASADLAQLLRLDPSVLVQPLEPPHLQMTLVVRGQSPDELIPLALTSRPELASQQAVVQATLQRLKAERLRPLIPSVLLRGAATNPAGTLAGGVFGGGRNDRLGDFNTRGDFDIQVLWEFQNLGFGNLAKVKERKAENQAAILELFRLQDRIAAEVAQAHAQVQSAAARITLAESEVKDARESVSKNFEGLEQTQKVGNVLILLIRPQEVVAAVQALGQAYNDYYGAVADYDRAQFRLFRALGNPANSLQRCDVRE